MCLYLQLQKINWWCWRQFVGRSRWPIRYLFCVYLSLNVKWLIQYKTTRKWQIDLGSVKPFQLVTVREVSKWSDAEIIYFLCRSMFSSILKICRYISRIGGRYLVLTDWRLLIVMTSAYQLKGDQIIRRTFLPWRK